MSLVHTPASYIHLSDPQVVRLCAALSASMAGVCEKAAREMMNKEMRLVAAQPKPLCEYTTHQAVQPAKQQPSPCFETNKFFLLFQIYFDSIYILT